MRASIVEFPSYDVGSKELKPVCTDDSIISLARPELDRQPRFWTCLPLPETTVPRFWYPISHSNTANNTNVSFINRGVGVVPQFNVASFRECELIVRDIARRYLEKFGYPNRLSRDDSLAGFKGKRKAVYERCKTALDRLDRVPPNFASCECFIKNEALDPIVKPNPDPRMIWGRDPHYNLEFARYLRPFEKKFLSMSFSDLTGHNSELPTFAKGRNSRERASAIRKHWDSFGEGACAMSIDGSRWDMHINEHALKLKCLFYSLLYPYDTYFHELLSYQFDTLCKTRNGLKAVVHARTKSGDMDTSLSANFLSLVYAVHYYQANRIPISIFDDGDDCLCFTQISNLSRLISTLPEHYRLFGQETKIEKVSMEMEQIEHCHTMPLLITGTWRMARNPFRAISHGGANCFPPNAGPGFKAAYYFAVSLGAFIENRGVPILQRWALRVIQLALGECSSSVDVLRFIRDSKPHRVEEFLRECHSVGLKIDPVSGRVDSKFLLKPVVETDAARAMFQSQYQIGVEEQRSIESLYCHTLPPDISFEKIKLLPPLGIYDIDFKNSRRVQPEQWYQADTDTGFHLPNLLLDELGEQYPLNYNHLGI